MALFGFGKKEEVKTEPACACNGNAPVFEAVPCCCGDGVGEGACYTGNEKVTSIKVLGAGCKSCHEQYENAKKAVSEIGLDVEVEYITDMEKVMTYGVMSMPAIVVNDKVASMGKVLKSAEVIELLGKLGL